MWSKIFKPVGMIIGGILLGVLIAFLFGWLVMLLWNWLMPPIFGLTTITFWQAWGLVVLAHLLFKAGHGHKHDHDDHFHSKCNWKKTFKEKIKKHFGEEPSDPSSAEETNPS